MSQIYTKLTISGKNLWIVSKFWENMAKFVPFRRKFGNIFKEPNSAKESDPSTYQRSCFCYPRLCYIPETKFVLSTPSPGFTQEHAFINRLYSQQKINSRMKRLPMCAHLANKAQLCHVSCLCFSRKEAFKLVPISCLMFQNKL